MSISPVDSAAKSERSTVRLHSVSGVARAWLPLALSWLVMALELPVVSAIVARLANPEVELAAYGSVIWPIALVVESPIIMLLSASTTLSRDRASYRALRRFMHRAAAVLTAVHLLIALTPLYFVVVGDLIGAPRPVLEAARPGLVLMVPWTWAIAYRRFNQGVLIRFGHNRVVTEGTLIRMVSNVAVMGLGWLYGGLPGSALAGAAVATGVLAEAAYSGLRVRPVVREHLRHDQPGHPPLRGWDFIHFYAPLAFTTMIALIAQPLGSAGVARMPEALDCLAALPVVVGLVFMHQSVGLALTEVVVAGLELPGSGPALSRFTLVLAVATSSMVTLIAATPLADLWFGQVMGLTPSLRELAGGALWLAIPIPALRVVQSRLSGAFVHARRTRPISEAIVVFLIAATSVLGVGIVSGRWLGIDVAMVAMSVGRGSQVLWLWLRSSLLVPAAELS